LETRSVVRKPSPQDIDLRDSPNPPRTDDHGERSGTSVGCDRMTATGGDMSM
jgi:hypothetical protein